MSSLQHYPITFFARCIDRSTVVVTSADGRAALSVALSLSLLGKWQMALPLLLLIARISRTYIMNCAAVRGRLLLLLRRPRSLSSTSWSWSWSMGGISRHFVSQLSIFQVELKYLSTVRRIHRNKYSTSTSLHQHARAKSTYSSLEIQTVAVQHERQGPTWALLGQP